MVEPIKVVGHGHDKLLLVVALQVHQDRCGQDVGVDVDVQRRRGGLRLALLGGGVPVKRAGRRALASPRRTSLRATRYLFLRRPVLKFGVHLPVVVLVEVLRSTNKRTSFLPAGSRSGFPMPRPPSKASVLYLVVHDRVAFAVVEQRKRRLGARVVHARVPVTMHAQLGQAHRTREQPRAARPAALAAQML